MFSLRSVFGSDGRIHHEQQVGTVRMDLTTGETSTVFGRPGGIQTVMGPNGQTHFERQVGGMRLDLTNGKMGRLF